MNSNLKLVVFGLILILYGAWPGRVCGQPYPVVVTGVVTSGSREDRLGDEFVGLYGERQRQGELDSDKTLALEKSSVPNEGQGPWGVYCLTSLNIDQELNELWVIADRDDKAAHPKLAKLGSPDQHGIRRVRVGDLVVNLIDYNRLRGDIETSADRIAAVIETEAVRSFVGVYTRATASERVLKRVRPIVTLQDKGGQERLFGAVPEHFQEDILNRKPLSKLVDSLLSDLRSGTTGDGRTSPSPSATVVVTPSTTPTPSPTINSTSSTPTSETKSTSSIPAGSTSPTATLSSQQIQWEQIIHTVKGSMLVHSHVPDQLHAANLNSAIRDNTNLQNLIQKFQGRVKDTSLDRLLSSLDFSLSKIQQDLTHVNQVAVQFPGIVNLTQIQRPSILTAEQERVNILDTFKEITLRLEMPDPNFDNTPAHRLPPLVLPTP
jgi:hypothetical protein